MPCNIPGVIDYRLLTPVQLQSQQLTDARFACRQASAALLSLIGGATDPVLISDAKRLQCALAVAADELTYLRERLRVRA